MCHAERGEDMPGDIFQIRLTGGALQSRAQRGIADIGIRKMGARPEEDKMGMRKRRNLIESICTHCPLTVTWGCAVEDSAGVAMAEKFNVQAAIRFIATVSGQPEKFR